MKIRALNESDLSNGSSDESSNDEGRQQTPSKEALEDQCFDKYHQAMAAIQELKDDEAKNFLQDLNEQLNDLGTESDTFAQLRFSVLKNLGNFHAESIDYYIDALAIDPSDITLWIKAGDRSAKLGNFMFAKHCYEQALGINPENWVAIERLMELYYILHLPFELYDICMRAISLNPRHRKALILLSEVKKIQPSLNIDQIVDVPESQVESVVKPLSEVKKRRRHKIQDELSKFKRARLGITLDTARTQSLASFGNYIIKIYERFARQGITRNSVIDITLNNTLSFSQQFCNGSVNSQSNDQRSCEFQTSCSQDIEMTVEPDGGSISDNDKPGAINEENDQTKSNSRGRLNQTFQKSSSLSFAAMLFPMDLGDKRRSSRNRSNQDDTFSFKMKFDELNELLPECLRIGAIEQALQRRREEQERSSDKKENERQNECIIAETNLEPIREDLIIKDMIEAIAGAIQPGVTAIKNDIKLCDMFYLYLTKLSSKKQNTLPEAYSKIYRIYRRLCPLPTGDIFVEIGQDGLTIDELWFTLTANEIAYQPQECPLLLRILEQLQLHLDEAQHKEFLVRLFLILGANADYRYLEVALQNIEEDTKVYASNRKIITRAYIKTLIDRMNEKLQQESEFPDDSIELINRLAPKSENEMSDREIASLCSAIKSAGVWQRGLDILNQRNDLNLDIIIETINICLENGATMDAILASKLCKDAISGCRPATWTCLYRGWRSVLTNDEISSEDTINRMDKFFELGHQTLGKKGTCTTDNGEYLMLYVKHLLDEGDNFEERSLLGALNCLFGYPIKKPASVAGHKATRVPMVWKYAEIIYHYLAPDELPTYMSLLRKVGITSELEPLLREIALSTPDELNPGREVHVIEDFIDKGKPLVGLNTCQHEVTKDIFYFLADFYFKNKDFTKAKEFYNYDLVINIDRFDSWAASGLIRANGIDRALSEGTITTEDFVEGPFHELADSAIRCFEQATRLKPNEAKATLWIEFGNLTYNLTSLASRLFAYDDFEAEIENKEPGDTSKLEARHKHLYSLAKHCFKSANSLCQSEEIWLHYYMLGKIYEKVDTFRALEYYNRADSQLFHEGASYPKKISYHNPPDLAYEAMEVHYRIHSSALKFLLNTHELTQDHMNHLKRFLLNAQRSPFVEFEGLQFPKSCVEQAIDQDVNYLLNDLLEAVCSDAEFDELIFMCLHGMKRCLVRCDKNFKALYRLSFYYQKIRDSRMAQDILIVRELNTDRRIKNLLERKPGVPEFQAAPPDLKGVDSLFKDRKMGNLFFNIWRIPVEEVDRPGCFEHWMFKCTWLLIKTCIDLSDTSMLTVIAFQLSRQPETSKKYLQDKARVLLALFAVKSVINIITSAIDGSGDDHERKRHFIKEGLTIVDRFIKANVFADRMRELFTKLQDQLASVQP